MKPLAMLDADEKSGSEAQMLRIVRDLERMIRAGKVQALSVVLVDTIGLVNHDQSYSTEDGSIAWLALAGAHGFAIRNLQGNTVDGWRALLDDEDDEDDTE